MKRFLIVMLIVSALTGASAKEPMRNTVLNLGGYGNLTFRPYASSYKVKGNSFAAIATNSESQTFLIFNDKIIHIGQSGVNDINRLGYVNLNESDGYIVLYKDKDSYYVNRRGKIEGPYDYACWDENSRPDDPDRMYHYVYFVNGKVYDNKGGNVTPSKGVVNLDSFKMGSEWKHLISVNGNLKTSNSEPVIAGGKYVTVRKDGFMYLDDVKCIGQVPGYYLYPIFSINSRGDYAFVLDYSKTITFYENESPRTMSNFLGIDQMQYNRSYLFRNGKKVDIPGNSTFASMVNITDAGELAFGYELPDERMALRLPGVSTDPAYKDCKYLQCDLSGEWRYAYQDNAGRWFARSRSHGEIGPYDDITSLKASENGELMAICKLNGNRWIVLGKRTFGPYESCSFLPIFAKAYQPSTRSFFATGTALTGQNFSVSEKGEILYGCGGSEIKLQTKDGMHTFYSDRKSPYVTIDGKTFGSTNAVAADIDTARNRFVWYCKEGSELVRYEYNY